MIAVNHLPPPLDVLHVVPFVLNLARNLNLLYHNLPNQVPSSLDLPGYVGIAVNHLRLQRRDMLDAPHVVGLVLNLPRNLNQLPSCLNQLPSYPNQLPNYLNQQPSYPNRLPGRLNLPGSVGIVVNYSLLLDMLDALHAVVFVPNLSPNQLPFMLFPSCQSVPVLPFLPHRVSHNVIVAAFRCHLATISPAVWNAEIVEGTCLPDLRHWLLGHVLRNGVNSSLVAWTWSAATVAPFIGELR